MAEKDRTEKTLEAYNDVFADIVNVLLFQGEQVVKPNSLIDAMPRSLYKFDGKLHEQERDVAKHWQEGNVKLAIYGLENQTDIDKKMPLRVIGYDGAAYRGQIANKDGTEKKYAPVVTLVLYFGEKHWQENKTLRECLRVPENIEPYINDYKINVFEIAYLSPEQVNMFKSDFKIVADYCVQMRMNKDYKPSAEVIQHVDEVLKLMTALTKDDRFENGINDTKGRSNVTMCEFLDKLIAKGETIGELKGIIKLVLDGTISIETGAEKANLTVEAFKTLIEEYKATGNIVLN